MFVLACIAIIVVLILLAIMRVSALVFALCMAVLSILLSVFLSAFWLVLLIVLVPLSIPPIRYHLFSRRLFSLLKKNFPPMSQTEKEAIDAGDVWWDAQIFSGKPKWSILKKVPSPKLSAEEQSFLDNETEQLCAMLDNWRIMHEDYDLPPAVWQFLKDKRFFAMAIKKEFGGLEFSALAHSIIINKIATRSPVAAVTAMVPNSLGPGELLMRYGTPKQQQQYLPRLVSGEEIPCFALTSPHAGSDAANMPDYAVVCKGEHQGQTVLGMKVTWSKHYITLAPVATLLGLAFNLYDPEHLLGDKDDIGITVALIPTDHPGVDIGQRHYPAFMPFMNGPTQGKEVFIPMDFIIGGQAMLGQGWRMLMECLSTGRAISLPAVATATAKHAYRLTGAYARTRQQFSLPIAKFEGVESALAQIAGLTYLIEATRLLTAQAVDLGLSPAILSAIAKYHTTEMSRQVINHAMDVQGGKGIQMGPKNTLASAYVGIPVSITVEGANILTRNLIIFGQGVMRCHPALLQEIAAMNNPDQQQALQQFDKALVKHIGFFCSNMVRTVMFALSGGRLMRASFAGECGYYAKQITRFSSALAFVSDVAMLSLGGALKRKENLSARLGDVLSYLCIASCVMKYFNDGSQDDDEKAYFRWAMDTCLYRVQQAFDAFFENYPKSWLGRLLRFMVMPYGRRFKKPSDAQDHTIVQAMISNSKLRQRLIEGVYTPQGDDPVADCEKAWMLAMQVSELEKQFKQAIKAKKISRAQPLAAQLQQAVSLSLLSEEEAAQLQCYYDAVEKVVTVDAFDPSYFEGRQYD